jgi:hypothetical protein
MQVKKNKITFDDIDLAIWIMICLLVGILIAL